MQHISGFDAIAESALDLRDECRSAFADGQVTQDEQRAIVVKAYQLCNSAHLNAATARVALRLLKGGRVDNRLLGEVRDAQALQGRVVDLGAYRRTRRVRTGRGGPKDAA